MEQDRIAAFWEQAGRLTYAELVDVGGALRDANESIGVALAGGRGGGVMFGPPWPREFVNARPSEECGCPEEEWLVAGLTLVVHLEPDGTGHAILDSGDWDAEEVFRRVATIDDVREAAFAWCDVFVWHDTVGVQQPRLR